MENSMDQEILLNAKTDQISFVLALRDAVGALNVLGALRTTASKEWERCTDIDSGSHLIKGVGVSTVKSDAITAYISLVVKQYMMSKGVRVTAWTKNTIASENFTNKVISNTLAGRTIESNDDLFKTVVTRLLGFDDDIVDMAIEHDNAKKAELLVSYLASKFDLVESKEEALTKYQFQVGFFHGLFDTAFMPGLYDAKIQEAQWHFDTPADDDHIHIFDPMRLFTYYGTK